VRRLLIIGSCEGYVGLIVVDADVEGLVWKDHLRHVEWLFIF